jgi:tetratricopeptide (TPR) repeat protein
MHSRPRPLLAVAGWVASGLLVLPLVGSEARAQPAPQRSAAQVVEALLADDWRAARAARAEVARLGGKALPSLLRARAQLPPASPHRSSLDESIGHVVEVLARETGLPLLEPAPELAAAGALGGVAGAHVLGAPDLEVPDLRLDQLGDAGSVSAPEPITWLEKRERAWRARGALALAGPGVLGMLLDVPPLREPEVEQALLAVVTHVYVREREVALAASDDPETFLVRYRGLADLAAPLLFLGLQDPEASVREGYRAVLAEALETHVGALDAPDPVRRQSAEEALFRLGPLARVELVRLAGDREASVHARDAAQRLARRVRFHLSRELMLRLGHDMADYDQLPFRRRRQAVLELQRLGGSHALPALRAILGEESSPEVQLVAAIALLRLGDPVGLQWLQAHPELVVPIPGTTSQAELIAIHMRQGIKHLGLSRYDRAEQEFRRVLELDPDNDIAWYNLACTYARWGRLEPALDALAAAIEGGYDDWAWALEDTDLLSLHDQPRFHELLRALGAPADALPRTAGGEAGR